MGLMINPAPTFTLNNGDIASSGKLYFYENGSTSVEKPIYLDPLLTTQLNNPLTLTDAGRLPACFGTGTYTIVLESSDGVQQWVRNDVSIDDLSGQFADYSSVKTYKANEIVRYTDGNYYASQKNNNKGNVPSANSEWWFQIAFLEFFNTAKAADEDYMENDIVIFNGLIYRSLENNNGDTPPSAKWANLTFNDSVAGNFTVGGDLSVTGGATIGGDVTVTGTLSSASFKYARRSSTKTITNSTTLEKDENLTITGLEPNAHYRVNALLTFRGNGITTNGYRVKLSVLTGNNFINFAISNRGFSNVPIDPVSTWDTTGPAERDFYTTNGNEPIAIDAYIRPGTGATEIYVEWAQKTASATGTSLIYGVITATRID